MSAAAEAGGGAAKKLLHSSKLMQMKFMQRGVQRKQMQEQSERQACTARLNGGIMPDKEVTCLEIP